jgi:hypothetical protein
MRVCNALHNFAAPRYGCKGGAGLMGHAVIDFMIRATLARRDMPNAGMVNARRAGRFSGNSGGFHAFSGGNPHFKNPVNIRILRALTANPTLGLRRNTFSRLGALTFLQKVFTHNSIGLNGLCRLGRKAAFIIYISFGGPLRPVPAPHGPWERDWRKRSTPLQYSGPGGSAAAA